MALPMMMVSGTQIARMFQTYLAGDYYIVACNQGGHEDGGAYVSADDETRQLVNWLCAHDCTDIKCLYGASMGCVIGVNLLACSDLQIDRVWFDGAALTANANMTNTAMTKMFLSWRKTYLKNPQKNALVLEKMYGKSLAGPMKHHFLTMSESDIRNICHACTHFTMKPVGTEMQKRMHIEWGATDPDRLLSKKAMKTYYPHAATIIRKGYTHCGYLAHHPETYVRELEAWIHAEDAVERLAYKDYGFCGLWHKAANETDARKALIVLGGSEGNENIPMNVSRQFAERGISTLGLCYFNVPGLPDSLVQVPVDPIETAVHWLNAQGYDNVMIYGISKGGELALLAASLIPEIKGVIALSPMHCVWTGMAGNQGLLNRKETALSEFTWRGEDLPAMQSKVTYGTGVMNLIKERQFDLTYIYDKPLAHFDESTAIKVENIQGDILFVYAKEDLMWPSGDAVHYMEERLKAHDFAHHVESLCYEKASHIIVPLDPPALKMFKVEREHPEECHASRMDIFEKSVRFVEAH